MATIEDWIALHDLYARYAWTIDEARYDDWIGCFTDDGIFDSPRFGRHSGREGLRKFVAIYRESLGGAKVRHIVSNLMFEVDGDSGTGRCTLTYFHSRHGKSELSAVGAYYDKLKKVNGQWLFASRQVSIDSGH